MKFSRALAEQNLPPAASGQAVGWTFGDFVLGAEFGILSDMGKIRRAGFHKTVDTGAALTAAIECQRDAGILAC